MKFQSGNTFGRGRPPGSRQRLAEALLASIAADFEQHGAQVIATVRERRPADYLRIVASLMPREVTLATDVQSHEEALAELVDEPGRGSVGS